MEVGVITETGLSARRNVVEASKLGPGNATTLFHITVQTVRVRNLNLGRVTHKNAQVISNYKKCITWFIYTLTWTCIDYRVAEKLWHQRWGVIINVMDLILADMCFPYHPFEAFIRRICTRFFFVHFFLFSLIFGHLRTFKNFNSYWIMFDISHSCEPEKWDL